MKLLFSEFKSDYSRYLYSYVIWAVPEPGETPAQCFARGFLPGTPNLDRYYLCRHLRVDLARFKPSSENRRILRKGAALKVRLVPRDQFAYTPARRQAWCAYAQARWGPGIMTEQRLDGLMAGRVVTHLLVFTDEFSTDVGTALLYVEEPAMAFYYYAFYDLEWLQRNLGMFMMTSAVDFFARRGFRHLYLGTCYSERALYKTQFTGLEFFNGFRWSDNLDELKYLIRREQQPVENHLLATAQFRDQFYGGDLAGMAEASLFELDLLTACERPAPARSVTEAPRAICQ